MRIVSVFLSNCVRRFIRISKYLFSIANIALYFNLSEFPSHIILTSCKLYTKKFCFRLKENNQIIRTNAFALRCTDYMNSWKSYFAFRSHPPVTKRFRRKHFQLSRSISSRWKISKQIPPERPTAKSFINYKTDGICQLPNKTQRWTT